MYKTRAKIGDKVYAIARYYEDKKETELLAVYEARVKYISIAVNTKTNKTEIEYLLTTPQGEEWGAEVREDEIHKDFNILMKKVKKEWISKSNRM